MSYLSDVLSLILSKPAQERAHSAGITVHDDGSVNQSDWYDKFSKQVLY